MFTIRTFSAGSQKEIEKSIKLCEIWRKWFELEKKKETFWDKLNHKDRMITLLRLCEQCKSRTCIKSKHLSVIHSVIMLTVLSFIGRLTFQLAHNELIASFNFHKFHRPSKQKNQLKFCVAILIAVRWTAEISSKVGWKWFYCFWRAPCRRMLWKFLKWRHWRVSSTEVEIMYWYALIEWASRNQFVLQRKTRVGSISKWNFQFSFNHNGIGTRKRVFSLLCRWQAIEHQIPTSIYCSFRLNMFACRQVFFRVAFVLHSSVLPLLFSI